GVTKVRRTATTTVGTRAESSCTQGRARKGIWNFWAAIAPSEIMQSTGKTSCFSRRLAKVSPFDFLVVSLAPVTNFGKERTAAKTSEGRSSFTYFRTISQQAKQSR